LLKGITENEISGQKSFFVGDLLQLRPVVQKMGMPVSRRMMIRIPCWAQIHKFILPEQHRCENLRWSTFVTQVAAKSINYIKLWSQVPDQFHVHVTHFTTDALAFCVKISDRRTDSNLIAVGPTPQIDWLGDQSMNPPMDGARA
jgi:hypothetical protein